MIEEDYCTANRHFICETISSCMSTKTPSTVVPETVEITSIVSSTTSSEETTEESKKDTTTIDIATMLTETVESTTTESSEASCPNSNTEELCETSTETTGVCKQYFIHTDIKTSMIGAAEVCETCGRRLATVETKQEHNKLQDCFMPISMRAYVALKDIGSFNEPYGYRWLSDGSDSVGTLGQLSAHYFGHFIKPHDVAKQCASYSLHGMIEEDYCEGENRHFICEKIGFCAETVTPSTGSNETAATASQPATNSTESESVSTKSTSTDTENSAGMSSTGSSIEPVGQSNITTTLMPAVNSTSPDHGTNLESTSSDHETPLDSTTILNDEIPSPLATFDGSKNECWASKTEKAKLWLNKKNIDTICPCNGLRMKVGNKCMAGPISQFSMRLKFICQYPVEFEDDLKDPTSQKFLDLSTVVIYGLYTMREKNQDLLASTKEYCIAPRRMKSGSAVPDVLVKVSDNHTAEQAGKAVSNSLTLSAGLLGDSGTTTDHMENMNECQTDGINECDEHATCFDTFGSYFCQCNDGYNDGHLTSDYKHGTLCIAADSCSGIKIGNWCCPVWLLLLLLLIILLFVSCLLCCCYWLLCSKKKKWRKPSNYTHSDQEAQTYEVTNEPGKLITTRWSLPRKLSRAHQVMPSPAPSSPDTPFRERSRTVEDVSTLNKTNGQGRAGVADKSLNQSDTIIL